jgi:hypothetical protein
MPIDMSAATKAPPRKRAANGSVTRQAPVQVETLSVTEKRAKGMMELGQLGQGILLMFGQYADAAAIGTHFPPVARELANVADSADILAKPIDFLIEVGPYGALIAAGMPLVMQLMANHRMLNADMLVSQGVVPPQLLEAQMKAQVAQMATEAMKAQQLAMKEAQAAQTEFEEMMAKQQAQKAA